MKGFFFRFVVIPGMLLILIRSCFGGAMGSEAMSVDFLKMILLVAAGAALYFFTLRITTYMEDDPDTSIHAPYIFLALFYIPLLFLLFSCSVPLFV